jgi:hypothetical protein
MAQTHLVGTISESADNETKERYELAFPHDEPYVVMDLFAEWGPSVSNADIKAFLYSEDCRFGASPKPNYQMFYGPSAMHLRPLSKMFDLEQPRLRFTSKQFGPVPCPLKSDPFQMIVSGRPITLTTDFVLTFSISIRPFNS